MKLIDVETVDYKPAELANTAGRLIQYFAEYTGLGSSRTWQAMRLEVLGLIRDQSPFNLIWETPGMEIGFSGFLDPRPTVTDGELIYASPEPRFAFIERTDDAIRPQARTHLHRVSAAIAHEMHEVYKLSVVDQNPLMLVFPKTAYARRIERHRIPLLSA